MFSRVAALSLIAVFAAVVAAAPDALEARGWSTTCSTGDQYCCNQELSGTTPVGYSDGLVGVLVGLVANIGLECTPITILGLASGAQCSSQAACCENDEQSGLVNIACTPINADAA